jgi:hypothetical protein
MGKNLPDAAVPPEVRRVTDLIIAQLCPQKVYLYNQRVNIGGVTYAFKLCIVLETADKHAAETELYMQIDCDVPFDLLMYTPREWEALLAQPGSFAGRIRRTGVLLYDAP